MLTTATLAQVVDPHQGELLQPDGAHLQLERLLRLQEQSERRQGRRYRPASASGRAVPGFHQLAGAARPTMSSPTRNNR